MGLNPKDIVDMFNANPELGRVCFSTGTGEDAWSIDLERVGGWEGDPDTMPVPEPTFMVPPVSTDASETGGGVDQAPASEWDDDDMWSAAGVRPRMPEGYGQ